MGEQHFTRTSIQMLQTISLRAEYPRTIEYDVDIKVTPWQQRDIRQMQNADSIKIAIVVMHIDVLLIMGDLFTKSAMAGIVLQQMRHRFWLGQFIHCHHFDVLVLATLVNGPKNIPTNASESVDRHF